MRRACFHQGQLCLAPEPRNVGYYPAGDKDVDFLIVSDASGRPKPERYQAGPKAFLRIITGIMMDQIRSLRSRAVLERMLNHQDPGVFLQIGNTCHSVLSKAGRQDALSRLSVLCLSDEDTQRAADMPAVIRKLTPQEYNLLFRHGFELADCALHAYHGDRFGYIGYYGLAWD